MIVRRRLHEGCYTAVDLEEEVHTDAEVRRPEDRPFACFTAGTELGLAVRPSSSPRDDGYPSLDSSKTVVKGHRWSGEFDSDIRRSEAGIIEERFLSSADGEHDLMPSCLGYFFYDVPHLAVADEYDLESLH